MNKWLLIALALLLPNCGFAANERFIVYYGDSAPATAFAGYDVIVFDGEHHPDIAPLANRTVLGYLSLGEAEVYRGYFTDINNRQMLLAENPLWEGHHIVDIRKPEWTAFVVETLLPALLAQGFNGVMLDTIDTPLQLEADDPTQYAGMQKAAVDLIHAIRARYPDMTIMLNRGFPILPQVARDINMVMAETIYTDWQPGAKKPVIQTPKQIEAYTALLMEAKRIAPTLKIYTVDYWPAEDTRQVSALYARQRAAGFIPYVASSLGLQTIASEPK